jgi:hypothetical protein
VGVIGVSGCLQCVYGSDLYVSNLGGDLGYFPVGPGNLLVWMVDGLYIHELEVVYSLKSQKYRLQKPR